MPANIDRTSVLAELVEQHGHFMIENKKRKWLHRHSDPENAALRKQLFERVLGPLTRASKRVIVYGSEFAKQQFEHEEKERAGQLLKRRSNAYEINLDNVGAIEDFPHFWADTVFDSAKGKRFARGNVLFLIDDTRLDFPSLLNNFDNAIVVTNLTAILGKNTIGRAQKFASAEEAQSAVVLLASNLVVFPALNVRAIRVQQAEHSLKLEA